MVAKPTALQLAIAEERHVQTAAKDPALSLTIRVSPG
jgi:hypothetical protein